MAAGLVCVVVGWQWKKALAETSGSLSAAQGKSQARALSELEGRGDALLSGWAAKVEAAGDSELEELAESLAKEPRGRDLALWIPLLARWSQADGAAMVAFVEKKAPAALREPLLSHAWFAWGISDPDAAFEAGGKLNRELQSKLLQGIAETDPRKAVACLWKLPDAQFSVSSVAARVVEKEPELAEEMLARAVYDGGRYPIQQAWISSLAKTDPAQAVAYAKSCGIIGHDPVPQAVAEIARQDPAMAAEQIAGMPANRAKSLSAVALVKVWAAQDAGKAAAWARANLEGPSKHYALVAAASSSASGDPEAAIGLLQEAGVKTGGDFFGVYQYGITPSETFSRPDVHKVTVDLLRRLAASDPEKAGRLAKERFSEGQWQEWAVEAGIQP